jgi:hypothetical protein
MPLPRNRTTVGVGEVVALSSVDSANWTVSGAGTLDSAAGGTVNFTANDTPGSATVTASAQGCVATSMTFQVIAPTGLFFVAVNGIFHTQGLADIGMQANVYAQPDSVSFAKLFYREQNASASASGIYSCLTGVGHNPNPAAVAASQNPTLGYGTLVALDSIQDGTCQPIDQHGIGSLSFAIPSVYKVTSTGTEYALTTVQHLGTASGGNLTIQKGAASRSTTVDSPSSHY